MSKQILSLENLWIARNNIFNCLLSFVMEKHKVQKRFITKLLEKARVTEKKTIYWVFDQVERFYVWKIKVLRKIGRKG